MAHWNGPITEEDFKESIKNTDEAIQDVKAILEISEKGQSNPRFPYQLSPSQSEAIIEKLGADKARLVKQYTCEHKNTTGLVNIGHDSHKDHYENKCKDCDLVLEWDIY